MNIWLSIAIYYSPEKMKNVGNAEFQSSFLKNVLLLHTKLKGLLSKKWFEILYQMRPKLENEYIYMYIYFLLLLLIFFFYLK